MTALPIPAHALPQRTPRELLAMARAGLDEAATNRFDGQRYATAHLAALRCAAAVLAARAVSDGTRRSKPASVWDWLIFVAPELTPWGEHFRASSATRAACEAGIPRVVTAAAAAMVQASEQFLALVETMLEYR